jgi:hypothetical protein
MESQQAGCDQSHVKSSRIGWQSPGINLLGMSFFLSILVMKIEPGPPCAQHKSLLSYQATAPEEFLIFC